MEQELKFVVKNNLSLQMHFSAKVLFDFIHGADKQLQYLIAWFEFFYKENVNNSGLIAKFVSLLLQNICSCQGFEI